MKQEIISFLTKNFNDVKNICEYLYKNPEESYKEEKSSSYICEVLKKYNFNIQKNYLDTPNSFYASKGSGYPKICFLCEYDAIKEKGHITGHNALAAISIGASISVGEIIKQTNGTIIIIGCPGEYLGGTKLTLVKQGVFDDIDVVMECHPYNTTAESGTSSAIIPLNIKFIGNSGLSFLSKDEYTSLDCILLTFNILNFLLKGFPKDVEVNYILSKGGYTPLLTRLESEAKFYIRAKEFEMAELAENKLREIVRYVSNLTHIPNKISLYESYNEELVTNKTLSRIFTHNLKENGIINIGSPIDVYAGLSIGAVSKKVPTIHPYISIKDDENIKYGSTDFADCTISEYGFEQIHKACASLACTALDLIEREDLLQEIKQEFYNGVGAK